MFNSYDLCGVTINPSIPSSNDQITLTYAGLLPKSGAKKIFAHICINGDWANAKDIKMSRTVSGFELFLTPPPIANSISVCFKDLANNWDNNSGMNYSFKIQNSTLETLHHVHSTMEKIRRQAKDNQSKQLVESLLADIEWIANAFEYELSPEFPSEVM